MQGIRVAHNHGLDDALGPQIAAAAAIDTDFFPTTILTGSGAISTVTPLWDGREIALADGGAGASLATACGGPVALAPYQLTRFRFLAGWNCWSHLQ
jgi:hypothetical protein